MEFSNTPGGSLNSKKQVAVLVLSRLRPDDEGIYKCRADFKRSPTKNNRMYLDVLSKYSILDLGTTYKCIYLSVLERERYMRSRVIPETDRPLSRLQLVRTVHLANRQDGIYPLPRPAEENVVANVAGFKTYLSLLFVLLILYEFSFLVIHSSFDIEVSIHISMRARA